MSKPENLDDKWEYDADPVENPLPDDLMWEVLHETGKYVPRTPEDKAEYEDWKKRNNIK